nr:hypothetical protein [Tanacetum cinerariifolium]
MTFSLLSEDEAIVLPSCLVDCRSLEMLTLNLLLHSLSLKSFTGSKTLKVLRLDSVELLDHDLVQSFLFPMWSVCRSTACSFGQFQKVVIVRKKVSQSLPNLKKLELKFDCDLMVALLRILKCSFNLRSLHLIAPKNISSYKVKRFFEELEGVETRRTLTCHLKRVEFSDFKGEKETLDIARFLLEHGNALEEMVFSWSNRSKYRKQLMEAMNEVSNFYKASSSVKVITLKD